MPAFPALDDYGGWVRLLADPIRSQRAFWHLVLSGPDALASVQAGLDSPNDDVRRWSTKAMDHLVDADGLMMLVRMLDDPDPRVRLEACHALACDRCKDNGCRPDAAAVLPRAIEVVLDDPDAHVRAYAVELVGRWVHTHHEAEAALIRAQSHDSSPAVRKKAGWYAPGGTIHRKTAPTGPKRTTARR
ncbi:MAG: HEAT repeat domain-containing protein [Ilumatobacteraceae bacterium]|nr:HEAT repeat domain-containing protein [Acidimicrobiales bacterium]